jgi:CBS domain-containing protein
MLVREIMTQNPTCCTPDSKLQDVARMMKENDCGCIPVVNSQIEMKPVGTITDRDITIRTVAESHNPINMKASDIMTADIATVSPQMSVEQCFDVMEDREIRRVLVVDEQGKCCGIVAQADIVQSGASPIRTNKVIREISESAPSHNQRIPMGRQMDRQNYRSHSNSNQSFVSGSSLLPLLIGLGSGIGLMYLLNTRRKATHREYINNLNAYAYEHENRQDVTNQESFGRYVDAEQEIEKRWHHLEDSARTLRTESKLPVRDRIESSDQEETITNKGKGRTAHQG